MQVRGLVGLIVSLALVTPRSASAEAGAKPKVVLGVVKGKGGQNLAAPIKKLIEKPLGDSAELIPLAKYKKGAKKAGIKPKDLWTAQAAQALGGEAGATHVLVIE